MRICILTPRFPFPENGGDVLRINNIARYLKEQNHHLILISFIQEQANMKLAYQLFDEVYCVEQHTLGSLIYAGLFMIAGRPLQCGYYHSWRIKKCVKSVEQQYHPDLYISHLLRMAPYLNNNSLRSKSIIEMTDALSKTYLLSTRSPRWTIKRSIYSIEYKLIKKYEQHVIAHFPKIVVVSDKDKEYLCNEQTKDKVVYMSNGVRCATHPSTTYNPNKICFIGNMRTLQNQDAVIYFVEDILPIIVKQHPKVMFYIIGAEPPMHIRHLACNPHVVVTGYVENVEEVISDSCFAIAPVRIAAGIQNKVLIALGQGLPCVISSLIASAIPGLEDGKNCYICDKTKQYAEQCLKLMHDKDLRQRLSIAGFELVNTKYQWDILLNGYENI